MRECEGEGGRARGGEDGGVRGGDGENKETTMERSWEVEGKVRRRR